jgi:TnpA family transposase
MTAIERTAYPRLKSRYSAKELDNCFTPTPADMVLAEEATIDDETLRLSLLAQLKCFQYLGYFPAMQEIARPILAHLRAVTTMAEGAIEYKWPHTLYRHRDAIRRYLNIKAYKEGGETVASDAIRKAAQTMGNPADLINAAIEELIRARIELPGFTTLDKLTQTIRTQVNETWYRDLLSRSTEADRQVLKAFPKKHDEQSQTDFTTLKESPGKPKLTEMRRIRDRLSWLTGLLDTQRLLEGIPTARIAQFAAEARSLEPDDIARYGDGHQFTLLCCFIHQATIETRDQLADIFIKRMRLIHQRAQEDLDQIREQQREMTEHLIRFLGDIAAQTVQMTDLAQLGTKVYELMGGSEGAAKIRGQCEALAMYDDNNTLPLLEGHYTGFRGVLFDLLDLLDLHATTQDDALLEALNYVKRQQASESQDLPAEISLAFASPRWQHLVKHEHDGQSWYRQHELELCVFSHVAVDLRAGDLCIKGSQQYADIREQMLPWEECLRLLPEYCQQLGLPTSAKEFVHYLRRLLARSARETDKTFPKNTQLSFDEQGRPSLKRIRKRPVPPEAKHLQRELRKVMPQRHLLDILVLVHRIVDFSRHFGPLSGSDPKVKEAVFTYLMTVFAFGSNIGAEEMARNALGAISARSLSATNHQHITAQKLDAALVDTINAYTRFELPGYWGPGKYAAADGTLIDLYENNLLSARHLRYGRYGGVAYYHIADNYIALFSHFISVGVWEAIYIIDGLLKNDSIIQPDTLHADTQGQSLPVFGLTFAMGIQLMPRIRNWKDLVLYRPTRHTRYKHINSLFSDTINWSFIERHWQDMMQVVISIQAGKLLPSTLLRKLGHHTPKNKLYRAFRELGRVVRTIFLLHYISDEPFQREVTTATNKVEAYHNFRSWIAFGSQGEITSNDPIEMTRGLHQLQQAGHNFDPALLAFISPYWTRHIRRLGNYTLRLDLPSDDIIFEVPIPPTPSPESQTIPKTPL